MPRGYDGSIRIDSSIDEKGFNKGIKNMSGGMTALIGVVGKLAAALGAAFAVKRVVDYTLAAARLTSEFQRLELAAQAVGQLYGFSAQQTRSYADELVASGIQTDIANKALIDFYRNGLDQGLLPALARGAQDLTVFNGNGESSSEVLERLLYAAITLQPEMARTAGVAVDFGAAYEKAAKAAGKTTAELSTQEKQNAALAAITEKLTGVSGLYEISQKTLAGQLSSNKRIMNEFRAAIGAPFQSALFKIVKGFNDFIKVMTAAIKPGGRFYALMVDIGAYATILADIIVYLFRQIASFLGIQLDTAKSTADAAAGVGTMADAQSNLADQTDKANKAAKGQLAAFDQLNVLAQNTDDTGDKTGAGVPVVGAVDAAQFTLPTEEIEKRAEEIRQILQDKLAEFLKNPIIARIRTFFTETLPKWIKDNKGPITAFAVVLAAFALAWLVVSAAIALWNIVAAIATGITTGLGAAFAFLTSPIGLVILLIAGIIILVVLLIKNWELLKGLAQVTWALIVAATKRGVENLRGLFYASFALWVAIFKRVWGSIKGIAGQIGLVFKIMLDNVKNNWFKTFTLVKAFVKNTINSIIGFINGMIAGIVNGLNAVIGALNSIRITIPNWIPEIGGSTFDVNLAYVTAPQIPYLAQGAVIPPNAEFAAILGDQRSGRNIETPERLLRDIIQQEIGNIQFDANLEITGNMSELVRLLQPRLQAENVRMGNSLVKSGATR